MTINTDLNFPFYFESFLLLLVIGEVAHQVSCFLQWNTGLYSTSGIASITYVAHQCFAVIG